jgi:hypothetical protein
LRVLGVILISLLLIILLFVAQPGLVLNEDTLRSAGALFNRFSRDSHVSWNTAHVEVTSRSMVSKTIRLELTEFCFRREPDLDLCHPEVLAEFGYEHTWLWPRITDLGPLRLPDGTLRFASSPDDEDRDEKEFDPDSIRLPEFLQQARIHPVHVSYRDLRVDFGEARVEGRLSLDAKSVATGDGDAWDMDLSTQLNSSELGALDLQARLNLESAENAIRLRGDVRGRADPSGDLGPFRQATVELRDCALEVHQPTAGASGRIHLRTDCVVGLEGRARGKGLLQDFIRSVKSRRLADLRLQAEANLPWPLDPDKIVTGSIRVEPRHLITGSLKSRGHLAADFRLVPAEWPKLRALEPDVDLTVTASKFQRFVRSFRGTRFAVPAPFHVLEGSVGLRLQNEAKSSKLDASLETDLASQHQKVDLIARTSADFEPLLAGEEIPSFDIDVLIRKLTLALPPDDITAITQMFPDRRLSKLADEGALDADVSPKMKYSIRIRSQAGHPIRLHAPNAGEPIPLAVDVKLTHDRPLEGKIRLGEFPLEVLGFERTFRGGVLSLRLTEEKDTATGSLSFGEGESPIRISFTDMTGLLSVWPEPKPQVPVGQVLTTLLAGLPVEVATTTQERPNPHTTYTRENAAVLELHFRH